MMQQQLWDAQRADEAKARAIDRVEAGASQQWRDAALSAVWNVAATRQTFTTDDVWVRIDDSAVVAEPRAMGAVMRKARAEGYIQPTDEFRLSQRVASHRRPLRVWESKVIWI